MASEAEKAACNDCGQPREIVNEADQCEECADAWFEAQRAYWRPLYLGEKQAGLLDAALSQQQAWRTP